MPNSQTRRNRLRGITRLDEAFWPIYLVVYLIAFGIGATLALWLS